MANKYLISGATYNGDGTSSAEATSNGGAGAWNTLAVFEGTAPAYGTLAAGDTVYIRSKTAGGADVTRTLTATLSIGSTAATSAGRITWVVDGGNVWPGVVGTVTYSCPSNYVVNVRAYNDYIADVQDAFVIAEGANNQSYKSYLSGANNHRFVRTKIDFSIAGLVSDNGSYINATGNNVVFDSVHVVAYKTPGYLIQHGSYGDSLYLNPNIELLQPTTAVWQPSIPSYVSIVGGSISGAGATSGVVVNATSAIGLVASVIGLSYPSLMTLFPTVRPLHGLCGGSMVDGSVGGGCSAQGGELTSRTDAYYPTLNATVPEQPGQHWSWMLYPDNAGVFPLVAKSSKMYVASAAAKDIIVELLVGTTFTEIDARNLWVSLSYVDDATGAVKVLNSRAYGTLESSSAAWSSTTYGAVAFDKRRIKLATPTAIKTNSIVHVALICAVKATTAQKLIVMCPDVVIA